MKGGTLDKLTATPGATDQALDVQGTKQALGDLTFQAITTHVMVSVADEPVHIRWDGTDVTAARGIYWAPGTCEILTIELAKLAQVIRQSAAGTARVHVSELTY
jgi:hypothetical protein